MDVHVSDAAASFDMIVMVDWSAAANRGPARPIPDRCWVAWTHVDDTLPPQARYFRTRPEAEEVIADLLATVRGNALVGFDFPFGYPAGSGLGGGRSLASRLATLIDDRPDGANNRFAVAARLNDELNGGQPGPFWGCPAHAECPTLTAKRSGRRGGPFTDSRRADARLLGRGIQSCWKLYTRGSVGGQMLVGLPAIHRLLTHPGVGARCRVWPFETGWDATLDGIVLAEIWPSLFNFRAVDHPIKDARQVIAVCIWARGAQAGGSLRRALACPGDLDPADAAICAEEEGWIFGLGSGLA
jgi:hypothetical protein